MEGRRIPEHISAKKVTNFERIGKLNYNGVASLIASGFGVDKAAIASWLSSRSRDYSAHYSAHYGANINGNKFRIAFSSPWFFIPDPGGGRYASGVMCCSDREQGGLLGKTTGMHVHPLL